MTIAQTLAAQGFHEIYELDSVFQMGKYIRNHKGEMIEVCLNFSKDGRYISSEAYVVD